MQEFFFRFVFKRIRARAMIAGVNQKKKIVIGAGGTGGHLLPAQQLATLLSSQAEVIFAGYKLEESPFFSRENQKYVEIPSAPFKVIDWTCWWGLGKGFFRALRFLRDEKPDCLVGFGSYHTAPLLVAAAMLRVPIVLYEANRCMGRVNRLIAPFAHKIAAQFPLDIPFQSVLVKLFPWIREERRSKEEAREHFGLDPDKKTVLVFGGSQGASYLNERIPEVAASMTDCQFLHLAGSEGGAEKTFLRYDRAGVKALVKSFEKNMSLAYAAADLAICRSGAGTIAELIRFQIPALLIPYPFASDQHQRKNGAFFVSIGGGKMVLQTEATMERINAELKDLDLQQARESLSVYEKSRRDERSIEGLIL